MRSSPVAAIRTSRPGPTSPSSNAFAPGLRQAAIDTLVEIGNLADGVRCDMAMLMLNDVFRRTWGDRVGPAPDAEYWSEVIVEVRALSTRTMLFIAEAYWDLEWELQQLGFDYCYDKRLYDRLVHDDPEQVRGHLHADLAYQQHLMRFTENHDEPRAASESRRRAARAAAVVIATVPGATMWHEGQFEGWRVHVPVLLGRRPIEHDDEDLRGVPPPAGRGGAHDLVVATWALCEATGWSDNPTAPNCSRGRGRTATRARAGRRELRRRAGIGDGPPALGRRRRGDRGDSTTASRATGTNATATTSPPTVCIVGLAPWESHLFVWTPIAEAA